MHSSSKLSCNMFSAFYIWGSQDRRTGSCLRRKSDRHGIWGFLVYVTPGCVALKLKPVVIQGDACSHDWWVLLKKKGPWQVLCGNLCLEGNLYVNVQNKATTKKSVGKKKLEKCHGELRLVEKMDRKLAFLMFTALSTNHLLAVCT